MSTAATAPSGPGRHEARERAIALLFEGEMRGLDALELLASLPLAPDAYAEQALRGIDAARPEIDRLITEHASGWTIDRMPAVDRAILRLGIWELLERSDVPRAVILDEAVELAKEYSTERSPAFVNGLLDTIAAHVRPI